MTCIQQRHDHEIGRIRRQCIIFHMHGRCVWLPQQFQRIYAKTILAK